MRIWLLAHLALSIVFFVVVAVEFDLQAAGFFALGTALSFANMGLLHFAWKRILAKKSIALAVIVIVLKYAITGYLIFKVAKLGLYPLGWTAGGLALFVLSALAMAAIPSGRAADQVSLSG